MLREEVPFGEVVRLEFTLPHGEVEVLAAVRQRSAFRYGFEFLESSEAHDVIGRTCRELSMDRVEPEPKIQSFETKQPSSEATSADTLEGHWKLAWNIRWELKTF